MQRILGCCFIMLAASCWAFIGPFGHYAMNHGVSAVEMAFWRTAFGGGAFLLHAFSKGVLSAPQKDALMFSLSGMLSIASLFVVYFVAIQEAGIGLAAILMYTAPAWVYLFSRLFFKERLTRAKMLALLFAVAGAALASASGGGLPQGASALGIFCGLLSGLLYSTSYIFCGHYLRLYQPATLYAWALPVACLCLLPFTNFSPNPPLVWLSLAGSGLVCTYAAYWAYCQGLRRISPTLGSIIATLEPVLAALTAWLIWKQAFSLAGTAGAALVLTAVLMTIVIKEPAPKGSSRPKEGSVR